MFIWYGRKPSSRSDLSVRAFRAYPLIGIRQPFPCRAIQADCISVNSTIPTPECLCRRRGALIWATGHTQTVQARVLIMYIMYHYFNDQESTVPTIVLWSLLSWLLLLSLSSLLLSPLSPLKLASAGRAGPACRAEKCDSASWISEAWVGDLAIMISVFGS